MNRRRFCLAVAATGVADPAFAQDDPGTQEILRQLREQGYGNFDVSRTWLGRVRIVAEHPQGTREIVYNPSTGALMRDHSADRMPDDGRREGPEIVDRGNSADRGSVGEKSNSGRGSSAGSGRGGAGNSSRGSGNSNGGGNGSGNGNDRGGGNGNGNGNGRGK